MEGKQNYSAGNAGSRTPRSGQIFENEREGLEELGRKSVNSEAEKNGVKRMAFTKKGFSRHRKKAEIQSIDSYLEKKHS